MLTAAPATASDYVRPATLDEAVALMAQGDWRVLAGGTDLYPGAGTRLSGRILDVTGVAGLSGVSRADGLRIGAATSWADLISADLPPALWALQQAARAVGGRQVQVAGTIGGNLCNASPAADGVPPLLVVAAEVELVSPRGLRRLALADFLQGPRRTARAPDELMTALLIPETALAGPSAFLKLGARTHLVISIVMAAARLVVDDGRVLQAFVAVGAASAVATRLPRVEAALLGAPLAGIADRVQAGDVLDALSPIDDVRASARYRQGAATSLVRRAIEAALA